MTTATAMRTNVRTANRADIPRLVGMGVRFLRETGYAGTIKENPAQMAALVEQMLTVDPMTVLVLEHEGALVGMIGILIFTHPLSAETIGSELFWWVDPEHRGSGRRLLEHAEQWAIARGAERMQMIAPAGTGIGVLYQRLGYQEIETHYQRVVP